MSGEREQTQKAALGSAGAGTVTPRPRPRSGVVMVREPRWSPRVCSRRAVQLSNVEGPDGSLATTTQATTLDVADGGLKLIVERPMTEGQRVVVAVDVTGGKPMVFRGRIAWTAADPMGTWFVGVAFDAIVPGFASRVTEP